MAAIIDGVVDDLANLIEIIPAPVLPSDVNGDSVVDGIDLMFVLVCFGHAAVPGCQSEDINGDGVVNVLDLIDLLLHFGETSPPS